MEYISKCLSAIKADIDQVFKEAKPMMKGAKVKYWTLGKAQLNILERASMTCDRLKARVEEDLKPKETRTLQHALAWVKNKVIDGTFVALLTEKGELVRTLYLSDRIVSEPVAVNIVSTPITLAMQKITLLIPAFNKSIAIPKTVKGFVTIVKSGEEVKQL